MIWINGYPGVGKLTIARAMLRLDPSIILVDHHTHHDAVDALYPSSHPFHKVITRRARAQSLLEYGLNDPARRLTLVFTDCQTTCDDGPSVAKAYRETARVAGRPFLPVYMRCDLGEHLVRLRSPERVESRQHKLVDPRVLMDIMEKGALYEFPDIPGLHVRLVRGQDPVSMAHQILQIAATVQAESA